MIEGCVGNILGKSLHSIGAGKVWLVVSAEVLQPEHVGVLHWEVVVGAHQGCHGHDLILLLSTF